MENNFILKEYYAKYLTDIRGLKNDRSEMVKQIYIQRQERFVNSGIKLSCQEFEELLIK